jgi:hypothetical protein
MVINNAFIRYLPKHFEIKKHGLVDEIIQIKKITFLVLWFLGNSKTIGELNLRPR